MMLATHGLRVALVTTHLPLRDVADAITAERRSGSRGSCMPTCATSSVSPSPASRFAVSTRMPAKAVTWAAKKSTSSSPPCSAYAAKAWTCVVRYRPIPCLPPNIWSTAMRCWRCTTTGPAGTQVQRLWRRSQRDLGPADHPHVGRPRHRLDLAGSGKVDTGSLRVALETAYQMAENRP